MTMLAAIPFASGFPIDAFMHGLVARLKRQGLRLGGVVQHNDATCDDSCMAMSLEDVASGRRFPISQDLGAGASGCHLDAAGLAAAAVAFSDALAGGVDLGAREHPEIGGAGGFTGAQVGAGDGEGFELHRVGGIGSRGRRLSEAGRAEHESGDGAH